MERRQLLAGDVAVFLGSTELQDGQASVSFGAVDLAESVQKTFIVKNTGIDPLTVKPVSVPAGFRILEDLSDATPILFGQQSQFTVEMDTTAGGDYLGTISFATSDPDENPFDFQVVGSVATNKGTDFWLAFQPNHPGSTPTLTLSLASDVAASGVVSIVSPPFTRAFTTVPGAVTTITVPTGVIPTGEAAMTAANHKITNSAIRVTADAPVSVLGLNRAPNTTDGFLGLPINAIGTEYMMMSYGISSSTPNYGGQQISIVGTVDGTQVVVIPTATTGPWVRNVPVTINLNRGQVYYAMNRSTTNDFVGMQINSDKPIAVFAGHSSAGVPVGQNYTDHITEQLTPIDTWGAEFIVAPLLTRPDYRLRVLAAYDGTVLRRGGAVVTTLNRGQYFEFELPGAAYIQTSRPALAMQFAEGANNGLGDPFMQVVPPVDQYSSNYILATPNVAAFSGNHDVNVIVPTSAVGVIKRNGVVIPAARFTSVAGTTFSFAQLNVASGTHQFTSGGIPFGLTMYGWGDDESYGFLGGQVFRRSDIEVRVDGVGISSGQGVIDYGFVGVGATAQKTFTIRNSTSVGELQLGTISVPNGFTMVVPPDKSLLKPGEVTSMTIGMKTDALGRLAGELTIINSDRDENPFRISLAGTVASPTFELLDGTTPIASGTGVIDFDPVPLNENQSRTLTIRNTGPVAMSIGSLIISGDTVFTATAPASSVLAPGAQTTFALRHSAAQAGPRQAVVSIANNDSARNPFTFQVGAFAYDQVDLTVTDIEVPTTLAWGSEVEVAWTLTNSGSGEFRGAFVDTVYISTDRNLGGDLSVATANFSGAILPGQSITRKVRLSLPPGVVGTRYFVVATDTSFQVRETIESNNAAVDDRAIDVLASDLVPSQVEAASVIPTGTQTQVKWKVTNSGRIPTPSGATWSDTVYLSGDDVLDAGDQLLAIVPAPQALAVGETYSSSALVNIAYGVYGTKHFIIKTDSGSQIVEATETNNLDDTISNVHWVPPDLQVARVASQAVAFTGAPTVVTWQVRNEGLASMLPAENRWRDRIWISRDTQLDGSDIALGEIDHTGVLISGDSYSRSAQVMVPLASALPAGDYYILLQTDSQQQVKEGPFEINNITAARTLTRIVHAPPPDLTVQRVGAPPTSAYAGQTIPIDFTVINSGAGATEPSNQSWIDGMYLSVDDRFDANDIFLGGVSRSGGLQAGESYNRLVDVLVPQATQGTFRLLVVTNINEVVFGDDTTNNSRASSQTITILKPPADLVTRQVVAPNMAAVTQKFKVDYEVKNTGDQATIASSWTDRVYLSTNSQWDSSDVLLTSLQHTTALQVDAIYTGSIEASWDTPGEYYVIVRSDADDQVFELDNLNNTRSTSTKLTIVPTPANLQPTVISVPSFAAVGEELPIEFRVANLGPNATLTSKWIDRVYLSTDQTLDQQDRLVSSLLHDGTLGATPDFYDTALKVPLDLSLAGEYYVLVHADSLDSVFELNNVDNIAASVNRVLILTQFPDLVITDALAPSEANTGDVIQLTWIERNEGDRDTLVSTWRERVYLSTDDTFSSSDRLLGEYTYTNQAPEGGPGALPPTASVTRSELVELPNDLPGSLFIFVVVDATDLVFEYQQEGNNVSLAYPITIEPRSVDLQVSSVTAPGTVTEGSPFDVSWSVRNAGNNSTNSNYWYDEVYLSTDPNLSSDDLRLSTTRRSGALAASGSNNDRYATLANTAVPLGVVQGAAQLMYLIVKTDAGVPEQVIEVNESNNTRATSTPVLVQAGSAIALPNLQVTNVSAPQSVQSGQPLEVQWSVTNVAATMSEKSNWIDAIYLSLDQVLDTTGASRDIYLGYAEQSRLLAAGELYTQTTVIDVPRGIFGDYYILIQTDQGQKISEGTSQELDNVGASQTLQVSPLPAADLIVGDTDIPGGDMVGRTVSVTYTITNASASAAVGNWYDAVYFSSDDVWDADDEFFGRALHSDGLAALQSYTQTVTASLPGMLPGQYRVIVRSDIMNNLVESNEDNNISGSLDKFDADMPLLTPGVSTEQDLGEGQSAYYKIVVPADRTMSIAVDSVATTGDVQIFVSKDSLPSRSRFDFAAGELGKVDQQLLVPDTEAATYYVLIYRATKPSGSERLSIRADLIGFSLLSSDVTRVGNVGTVTLNISGAQLRHTQSLALIDAANQVRREASRFVVSSSSSLFVTFDLTGLALGAYTLEATNASAELATLSTPILVESLRTSTAKLSISTPNAVRLGQTFEVTLTVFNDGNVDVAAPLVQFDSDSTLLLGYSAKDLQDQLLTVAIVPPGGYRDAIRPGQAIPVTITAREKIGSPGSAKLNVRSVGQAANQLGLIPLLADDSYDQIFGADAPLMRQLLSNYESGAANQLVRDLIKAGAINLPEDIGYVDAAYARRNQLAFAALLGEYFDLSSLLLESQSSSAKPPLDPPAKPLDGVTFTQVGSTGSGGKTRFIVAGFLAGNTGELWPYAMAARLKSICENDTIYVVSWNSGNEEELKSKLLTSFALNGLLGGGVTLANYYGEMAAKTPALGEAIAQEILRQGVNPRDVVLYGHSLGAQATGFAGSILARHPAGPIGQIVGFDPAGPSFGGDDRRRHLDASDATLVQVINSSKVLGRYRCDGDENYYVQRPDASSLTLNPVPAHSYSHEWYFEQLLDPDASAACKGTFSPDGLSSLCPLPDRDIGRIEGPDAEEDRTIRIVRAFDPNDMLGPTGFGPEKWVPITSPLAYTIRFENDPRNASAPAQRIDLTTTLDSDLDFRSFRLGDFGWGDFVVDVPENRSFYSTRLDLRETHGILVDAFAGIDVTTGEAFWSFIAIDPETGETPDDPLKGILPPNVTSPEGEGFARYSVYARADAVTGTRIDAQTRIVFDINPPLDTPPIFNTLDAVAPTSHVLPVEPEQPSQTARVLVQWTGTDDENGSAVRDYDIFVSTAGGPYQLWLDNVTTTQAFWEGLSGVDYAFYSVARDNAGMVEAFPDQLDSQVKVTAQADVQLSVDGQALTVVDNQVYFGTVVKNATVPLRQITITNTGTENVVVQPARVVQTGAAFAITSNVQADQVIRAGESITLEISFDTSSLGEPAATLEVPTSVTGKKLLVARLAGRVVEPPALSVQLESVSISESGGFVIGKVRRNSLDPMPLRVTLTSSDPSKASVPTTLDLAYAAETITFRVMLTDNQLLDPTSSITIGAAAAGLASGNASFELLDDERASLTLTSAAASMPEKSGSVLVSVELALASSTETVIDLTSSAPDSVQVPASVRIPAGQTKASFTATTRDDQIAQGNRTVKISATAQRFGLGEAEIVIDDDEVPTLTLTLDQTTVSEGVTSVQATISRNTPTDQPLIVSLLSSDPSVATVAATQTIASGASSTTFAIQIVDDNRYRGPLSTTITASASPLVDSQVELSVTDNDPNFPWTNLILPEDVNADAQVTPLDALLIINQINRGRVGPLGEVPPGANEPPPYYDVNRDLALTPIDALYVINYINQGGGGEGEARADQMHDRLFADLSWLEVENRSRVSGFRL